MRQTGATTPETANGAPPRQEKAARTQDLDWGALTAQEAAERLKVDPARGLSSAEAASRLAASGPNRVEEPMRIKPLTMFIRQFADALTAVLLAAAAISATVGETTDALVIIAIVLLNGGLGFLQEWRADTALAALKAMLAPQTTVLRDGAPRRVDAETLTPGDVVLLSIGDAAPADLRLTQISDLEMDESLLTGESTAAAKAIAPDAPGAAAAERRAIAYAGASVVNGRGAGIVVATGRDTEFGRIAEMTRATDHEETPLKKALGRLGRRLGAAALTAAGFIFLIGLITGKGPFEMAMTAVSLAVAAVPEGLPTAVTVTLALGVGALARRRALLRRLQAAEALGAATVICTDKTGTITQNEMTAIRVAALSGAYAVDGVGYRPEGAIRSMAEAASSAPLVAPPPDLVALGQTALICNDASLERVETEDGPEWRRVGAPTEAALVALARKIGAPADLQVERAREISFNSDRKRMTVVERRTRDGGAPFWRAHVKGAPETLLERSAFVLDGDQTRPLTGADLAVFEQVREAMLTDGLRVLAIARRDFDAPPPEEAAGIEKDLTLIGLVGVADPPRPEAAAAIETARRAGVRVVMITGDAGPTALAIGRAVGLVGPEGEAVTGREVDRLSDAALRAALTRGAVFARTTPAHKMRIVRLLQADGEVVAMTGDGVNDAPALKAADVGVAMGKRGSDVAKGASDIVLTDDNFASIVAAVEEGRRQFDNIKKFVRYLLSSNLGEIVAILAAIVIGGPLILLPAQILWMNLVTDGATALALGFEPLEKNAMRRPPRPRDEGVLDGGGAGLVALFGVWIGAATAGMFFWALGPNWSDPQAAQLAYAQTMAFTVIVVLEKANVFNFKTLGAPLTLESLRGNLWLLAAVAATLGLQALAVHWGPLQAALKTVPLSAADWGLIALVALPVLLIPEVSRRLASLRTAADRA